MSTTSSQGDYYSTSTAQERDRARWAALEDAEATVAAIADALGRNRIDDVRRHAMDLEKIAAALADQPDGSR